MRPSYALPLLFALACGDTSTEDDTTTTGETGMSLDTVVWSGHAVDFISEANLAGTEACVRDYAEIACVTADSEGMFELEVPRGEDVIVELSRDGYTSVLVHMNRNEDFTGNWQVIPEDGTALLVMQSGGTLDPAKAHITSASNTDGLVAEMTPFSGIGTIYLSELNLPQDSLDATSSSGFFGWANVDPGEVEISWTHPDKTCTHVGWAGSTDSSFRLVLEAGTISGTFGLVCE